MRIGLIVNPIAGTGGPQGWKGTDSYLSDAWSLFRESHSSPSYLKTFMALRSLTDEVLSQIEWITVESFMGQEILDSLGFSYQLIDLSIPSPSSSEDTKRAILELSSLRCDLVLFVGGDGTARDLISAVPDQLMIGIPGGVKIFSSCFLAHPENLLPLLDHGLEEGFDSNFEDVLDINEDKYSSGILDISLFGAMKCPLLPHLLQGSKVASPTASVDNPWEAISTFLEDEGIYDQLIIAGPGSSVSHVLEPLTDDKTLLGVDVFSDRKLHSKDCSRDKILAIVSENNIDKESIHLIVSPIGGQGFLFGRGNQQIPPSLLALIPKDNIHIVSSISKLEGFEALRIDTGDTEVDDHLTGFIKVITGYRRYNLVKIKKG
ncbi:MAG: ATP-NAD kinase family protein [Candidatus Kariarchaeaceae archaeon]